MIRYKVTPKPYILLRSLATLIDYGIFLAISCALIYSLGEQQQNGEWKLNGLPALSIPLVWFLYFVLVEAINQATLGHYILKLKIMKPDGYKISVYEALKRRICDPIDIALYGIPALICINKTPKHQRVGDLLANTVVVKKSDIIENDLIFEK